MDDEEKIVNREMQYWEAKSQIILILKQFWQGTKKNKDDSDYISGFLNHVCGLKRYKYTDWYDLFIEVKR